MSSSFICRFQTVSPIPFLKAAIVIPCHWSIHHLIHKIHHTILQESNNSCEYLSLLNPSNPHPLLLELVDGCRLPINEPCTIIQQEHLLIVRLPHNPSHPPASQSNYPRFIPSWINASQRFSSHLSPSPHHLNHHPSNQQSILHYPSHQSNLFSTHSSTHTLQDHPIPASLVGNPSQTIHTHPSSHFHHVPHVYSGQSPSSQAFDSTCEQHQFPMPEPSIIHPVDQSIYPSQTHFASAPQDPPSTLNMIFPSTDHHSCCNLTNPVPDPNSRFQTVDLSNHLSTQSQFSLHDNSHVPPEKHPPPLDHQSKSDEFKPSAEELDQYLPDVSDDQVPRVRSHIAGLRKCAMRHYLSSYSPSSSSQDESLDFSDQSSVCFSRHAQILRSRERRKRKIRMIKSSKRLSLKADNERRKSLRPSRKSLPIRPSPGSSSTEEIVSTQKTKQNPQSVNLTTFSCKRSTVHRAQSSTSTFSKNTVQVRVVIPPPSPSLVSLLQQRNKFNKMSLESANKEMTPLGTRSEIETITSDAVDSNPSNQQVNSSPQLDRNTQSATKSNFIRETPHISPARSMRSVYEIYIDDELFKAAWAKGPMRIPCSKNSGLNEESTLIEVIKRVNLDQKSSWKMMIGDKIWISRLSLLRLQSNNRFSGLIDGKILQLDFNQNLKILKVFPSNSPNRICNHIHIIRNWDLH